MRVLLFMAGLMLALAFQAMPGARADGDARLSTVYASTVDSVAQLENCEFPLCADAMQEHAPCGCSAFVFAPVAQIALSGADYSLDRAFDHDSLSGRTLLPPVPPPLA